LKPAGPPRRGSSEGGFRAAAQLIDGETGEQLWSESLDGRWRRSSTSRIGSPRRWPRSAEPRIQAAEIARSRRERPGSVATYDVYLRALAAILSETEAGNAAAHALVLEGLGQEPVTRR